MEGEMELHRDTLETLLTTASLSHEQLDTYTETLSNIFQAAMVKMSQPNRKSLNSKPWWDQELKDAVTRVNTARYEHHNYQRWTAPKHKLKSAEVETTSNDCAYTRKGTGSTRP